MLSADFEFYLKHNVRQALSAQCTEFLEHFRALSTHCSINLSALSTKCVFLITH
jgi:hypothetical protein